MLRASKRLDPFHGRLLLSYLGVTHFMLEEHTQALAIMRDFVAQAPVRPWGHAMLALILAQLGRAAEATTEAAETLRLDSTFTVSARQSPRSSARRIMSVSIARGVWPASLRESS